MTLLEKEELDEKLAAHERELLASRSLAQKVWDGYQDFLELHPIATFAVRFGALIIAIVYFIMKVVIAR